MIHPHIHIGGTAKEELLGQWTDARDATRRARRILLQAEPHARDYADNQQRYYLARQEHVERLLKLASVVADLNELIEKASQ